MHRIPEIRLKCPHHCTINDLWTNSSSFFTCEACMLADQKLSLIFQVTMATIIISHGLTLSTLKQNYKMLKRVRSLSTFCSITMRKGPFAWNFYKSCWFHFIFLVLHPIISSRYPFFLSKYCIHVPLIHLAYRILKMSILDAKHSIQEINTACPSPTFLLK